MIIICTFKMLRGSGSADAKNIAWPETIPSARKYFDSWRAYDPKASSSK